MRFQSTPPVKAATLNRHFSEAERDISIHAAREGGDQQGRGFPSTVTISIHAAREGGDRQQGLKLPDSMISIHAAREGGDDTRKPRRNAEDGFQSTPPVKAATRCGTDAQGSKRYFNPRRP